MIQLTPNEQYAQDICQATIQQIACKSQYCVYIYARTTQQGYDVSVEIYTPIPRPTIKKAFNSYYEAVIYLTGLYDAFCLDYHTIYG